MGLVVELGGCGGGGYLFCGGAAGGVFVGCARYGKAGGVKHRRKAHLTKPSSEIRDLQIESKPLLRHLRHHFKHPRHIRCARPRCGRADRVAPRDRRLQIENHIWPLPRAEAKPHIQRAVCAVRDADDPIGDERLGVVNQLTLQRAQRSFGFVGRAAGFDIYRVTSVCIGQEISERCGGTH